MESDKRLLISNVVFILIWTLFAVYFFLYFSFQIYSSPESFNDVVTIRFYSHPI